MVGAAEAQRFTRFEYLMSYLPAVLARAGVVENDAGHRVGFGAGLVAVDSWTLGGDRVSGVKLQ